MWPHRQKDCGSRLCQVAPDCGAQQAVGQTMLAARSGQEGACWPLIGPRPCPGQDWPAVCLRGRAVSCSYLHSSPGLGFLPCVLSPLLSSTGAVLGKGEPASASALGVGAGLVLAGAPGACPPLWSALGGGSAACFLEALGGSARTGAAREAWGSSPVAESSGRRCPPSRPASRTGRHRTLSGGAQTCLSVNSQQFSVESHVSGFPLTPASTGLVCLRGLRCHRSCPSPQAGDT